ncbi:hypothetical protein [uncultured Phenylobacterium sp.]|uniref:hypothetical protein n=1 Tax=uncultured Phenylobacterium sp. TaxID=349273 RepID=UPI0025F9EF48|nr:hypothetical protein [uncultured Phenylobacterium sp.]
MDVRIMLGLAGGLAALAGFAGWRGARPPNPMKGPRLIPWRMIMVLATAAAIAVLFTALQALGIHRPGG